MAARRESNMDRREVESALLDQLIQHIYRVQFGDIPAYIVDRAKDEVIDTIGCILAGGKDRSGEIVLEMVKAWGGRAESSIIGSRHRVPAHHAAFANAVMARAFDYGVVDANVNNTIKPVHISETLVPVALAVAEHLNTGGRQLLTALITGEDIVSRIIGCANFIQPMDLRGTVNTLGAVIVAGKMRGISPSQMKNALGIALHQIGGVKQGIHFNLGQGYSAMNGIMSVELAARDFWGVDDLVSETKALFSIFSDSYDSRALFEELGVKFNTSVTFKPYPSCRATHAAIECALELVQRYSVTPNEIRKVVVVVSPWVLNHLVGRPFRIREYPHSDAVYSIQYAVANILLRGHIDVEHYTEPFINDPAIQTITQQIEITSEGWPLNPDDFFQATTVILTTRDNRELRVHVDTAKGNEALNVPMSSAEKKDKFMRNVAFSGVVTATDGEKMFHHLKELENIREINELMAILG